MYVFLGFDLKRNKMKINYNIFQKSIACTVEIRYQNVNLKYYVKCK